MTGYSEDIQRTPEEAQAALDRLLNSTSEAQSVEDAIAALGTLIDLSGELRRSDATSQAIRRGGLLLEGTLTDEQRATVHYFLANAWEIARIQRRSPAELEEWEQPESEAQVIHLRRAARLMESFPKRRR